MKLSIFSHRRGSIFIYVFVLAAFAMMIGYVLFQTQQLIYSVHDGDNVTAMLDRNMQAKSERAFDLSLAYNSNGSGMQTVLDCPEVTFSGSTLQETLQLQHYFLSDTTVCATTYLSGSQSEPNFFLYFSSDFGSYSGASYQGISATSFMMYATGYIADFSDSDATRATWDASYIPSSIDADQNSDNYRSDSYSGVYYRYFSGGALSPEVGDDDALARQMITGFVTSQQRWLNIYWPTPRLMSYIQKNPHNQSLLNTQQPEILGQYIGSVVSGAVYLETEDSLDLKIIEYDRAAYADTGLRRILNQYNYTLSGGVAGFLSSSGIITGSYRDTIPSGAKRFDFHSGLYAFFLGVNPELSPISSPIEYLFRVKDASERDVYIVPIIDTTPSASGAYWSYWANDIVLSDSGEQYANEREIYKNFVP